MKSFINELFRSNTIIIRALREVCAYKMVVDGYFDASFYIEHRTSKIMMLEELRKVGSSFVQLFILPNPNPNELHSWWYINIDPSVQQELASNEYYELKPVEYRAIVYWVYGLFKKEERMNLAIEFLRQLKVKRFIDNEIRTINGVVYNSSRVSIKFIESVSDLSSVLPTGERLFYRGHSNANFLLMPAIMRTKKLLHNENTMYQEILINCPHDFEGCNTHLEKLVKMQHYGLPTRLLDITRNPLVALYFACNDENNCYGEVIILDAKKELKYPNSDTATILASLPAFSHDDQMEYYIAANDKLTLRQFNGKVSRLLQEIKCEKPAFLPKIVQSDLLLNIFVYALKSNHRIVRQDGAFILCGLSNCEPKLYEYRYNNMGLTPIVLVKNKDRIVEELKRFSINGATLFPEIDSVAKYIRGTYS